MSENRTFAPVHSACAPLSESLDPRGSLPRLNASNLGFYNPEKAHVPLRQRVTGNKGLFAEQVGSQLCMPPVLTEKSED